MRNGDHYLAYPALSHCLDNVWFVFRDAWTDPGTGKSADSRPSGSAAQRRNNSADGNKRARSREWPMHQCRPTPTKDAPRQTTVLRAVAWLPLVGARRLDQTVKLRFDSINDQAVCGTYAFLRLDGRIGLLAPKCRSVLRSNG
jgi:hypothetical protein